MRYTLRKIVFSLFFCGLNFFFTPALSSEVVEKIDWHVTGLPFSEHFDTVKISTHPQNFRVKQDEKGFIYVANGAGVLIYDGQNWQLLKTHNHPGAYDFELTENGRIYVGTAGDLGYFEAGKSGIWQFTSLSKNVVNLPNISHVYRVLQVENGIVFLSNTHLFYYSPESGLSWYEKSIDAVDCIFVDDQLIVSTRQNKLLYFDFDQTPVLTNTRAISNDLETSLKAIRFEQLSDGNILLFGREKLILKSNQGDLEVIETQIDAWLAENKITDVIELPDDRFAISTRSGGLAIITKSGKLIRFYSTEHGLNNNAISSLFADREGSLWLTSYSSGVTRVELDSAITQFSTDDEFHINLSTVEFLGRVFMGAQFGLFYLQPSQILHEQAKFLKVDSEYLHVMSLLNDGSGLLVGHLKGIDILSVSDNGTFNTKKIDLKANELPEIFEIIRNNKAHNEIFAMSQYGIIKLIKLNGEWQSLGYLKDFDKRIESAFQDQDGKLWIGVEPNQYYYLDELNQWPSPMIKKLDTPIKKGSVGATIFGLDNKILISNGLGEPVDTINTDAQPSSTTKLAEWANSGITGISYMSKSNQKQAWFVARIESMNMFRVGEISSMNGQTYDIDFNALDRLRLDFVHAIYQDPHNVLWINTNERVIRYDPNKINSPSLVYSPVVSEIKEISTDHVIFNHAEFQHRQSPIQLTAEQNAIRINFSSADYIHSRTEQYRYRLGELDSEWTDWQSKTSANFTNIAPGEHLFELQYRTNPKSVSEITELRIIRAPYWFQSLLGQTLITVLVITLFILVSWLTARIRTNALHKKALALESQIEERTMEITEKNNQLADKNKLLRQMDEAKSRFLTNMSHEFRTPLSLSIGPLKDTISAGRIKNNKDLEYVKLALKNNLHMMDLLSQMLDIDKIEADKMPISVSEINLVYYIKSYIKRFQVEAEKQSIRFKTNGLEKDVLAYFDKDHFEKILMNLLSNAVKFSPKNSEILVTLSTTKSHAKLVVADQGTGIDADDLPFIFDRFYQARPSPKETQEGTGIGLALVKELMALHQGKIQASSQLGRGSQFTLTILLGSDHYNASQMEESERISPHFDSLENKSEFKDTEKPSYADTDIGQSKGMKTLLVIDDNADIIAYIKSSLEETYHIIEAENGLQGLQMAQQIQPDLIVSDVMMPEVDGYELTKLLKTDPETAHIPLILLTAKSSKQNMLEGLQIGADDYITKPFDSDELAARIASLLTQKQRVAQKILQQISEQPITTNFTKAFESDAFSLKLDQIIFENMGDEQFDVSQMFKKLNITRSTLFRRINDRFNCTPYQLLKSRRLELAHKMLVGKKGSTSEIAYAVGFHSVSTFSRAFSKKYQVSPSRIGASKTA